MCDLRKGFDLPRCICNKAPCSTFKGLLFNLHHHRAYSKAHNVSSSSPRLAYTSILLICWVSYIWFFLIKKKWCRVSNRWKIWSAFPSASIQTRDLFDCHPLNHPHLFITPSWHMWLYIEYKDQIALAAFQLLFSKLKTEWENKDAPPIPNCEQIALCYKLYTAEPV